MLHLEERGDFPLPLRRKPGKFSIEQRTRDESIQNSKFKIQNSKHRLLITNYELRITNYELHPKSWKINC